MRRILGTLIAGWTVALSAPTSAQSLTQVLGAPVSAPLSSPVFVTSWPGNATILVVAERGTGKITFWDTSVVGIPTHDVLDLSAQAFLPTSFGHFVGVTGFAFHPEFLTNPSKRFLFVRYNAAGVPTTYVKRWTILPGSLKAAPSTVTTIYTWPTLSTAHGSGTIQFDTRPGHEDLLYVPMPDDSTPGNCCDEARVQQIAGPSDLGQLMVVDVGATPPIAWNNATGLRNPFGFSVDQGDATTLLGRGDVWIGDVGGSTTGSVLRWIPTGLFRNYGWPWKAGDATLPWSNPPTLFTTTCGNLPAAQCGLPPGAGTFEIPYSVFSDFSELGGAHDALIGGYVYREAIVAPLTNRYVFATYGVWGPRVYSLPVTGASGVTPINHSAALGVSGWPTGNTIHALGQDYKGEIYIVRVNQSTGSQLANGAVFKVIP